MSSNFLTIARQLHTLASQLADALCARPSDPFGPLRAEAAWQHLRRTLIAVGNSLNAHSCPIADWVRRLGRAAMQFDKLVSQHGMGVVASRFDVAWVDGLVDEGGRLLREHAPRPADPFAAFTNPPPTADPGPAPPPAMPTPSTPPPAPSSTSPTPSTPSTRKRRAALNSAAINHAVADWLRQHATDPFAVTIRAVACAVGVSVGAVAGSAAWRAFESQRRKLRPRGRREVLLADELLAILPARDRAAELEQLVRDQEADRRRDERRSRRSGRCS
jgi:hypothetical protein